MTPARTAVAAWLGSPDHGDSRIEALYRAVEDCDMTAIRAMMEGVWQDGCAAGSKGDWGISPREGLHLIGSMGE